VTPVPTQPPAAEAALRDAALRGDRGAWRVLYDAAAVGVAGYVRWRSGGRADWADDATQDAWLTAAKSLARFDPAKGPFEGWVCGIAANAVRNRLKSWTRYVSKTGPLAVDLPQRLQEPDRDSALRVASTLAALPEQYEAVLRAKYLDGRSVNEIAADAGTGGVSEGVR
jgi:RNA polymerase sigma-70 factor (ECF subfamily)